MRISPTPCDRMMPKSLRQCRLELLLSQLEATTQPIVI